jgi:hypothetical protein
MKKLLPFFAGCLAITLPLQLWSQKLWNEDDRAYLLSQLKQTREALLKETSNLSDAQWNFKESPDRWSIKEVTEHIGIWELLLTHEVSNSSRHESRHSSYSKTR